MHLKLSKSLNDYNEKLNKWLKKLFKHVLWVKYWFFIRFRPFATILEIWPIWPSLDDPFLTFKRKKIQGHKFKHDPIYVCIWACERIFRFGLQTIHLQYYQRVYSLGHYSSTIQLRRQLLHCGVSIRPEIEILVAFWLISSCMTI